MPGLVVTVVDYGAGNIRSVVGALHASGANAKVTSDFQQIAAADRLLIPGVGSFRSAMDRLVSQNIDTAIREAVSRSVPILGICLGMQLLCNWSDEDGGAEGLGIFDGRIEPFTSTPEIRLRIPHVGFNRVQAPGDSILMEGISKRADFYFAHSYRLGSADSKSGVVTGTTNYGTSFISIIEARSHVFAVQFHPELSQGNGLALLRNFLDVPTC